MRLTLLLPILLLSLSSCKTTDLQLSNNDELLFVKAYRTHEIIDEFDYHWDIEDIDTTFIEDRIRYEILVEQKDDLLEESLELYNEILQLYPETSLKYRIYHNLGHIEYELGYLDDAENNFLKIINGNPDNKEYSGNNNIMGNPNANYQNNAIHKLIQIALDTEDYSKALKYLEKSEQIPLQHFCGNAYASEELRITLLYVRAYKGIGNIDKAINTGLLHVFNTGLTDNTEIIDITVDLIKGKYSEVEIKEYLSSIKTNLVKDDNGELKYVEFKFMNTDFIIYDYAFHFNNSISSQENMELLLNPTNELLESLVPKLHFIQLLSH